jgi:hypothetical protein
MKNSRFSEVFCRYILSVLLVLSTTLAVGNLAAAADENDQSSRGGLQKKSARVTHQDNHESSVWERNLRLDRFDGARLVQAQFMPAPYCYTFSGPVCSMSIAVPQGSRCSVHLLFCGLPAVAGQGGILRLTTRNVFRAVQSDTALRCLLRTAVKKEGQSGGNATHAE